MGVKGLWKLLKESYCTDKNMDWKTMHGSIWAVDLSFWIVEASTAMQHVKFTDPTFRPHLRNLFFRIKHLLSLGIRPVFVFDGAPPKQKYLTLQKRGVLGNINRRNKKKKYSHSVFGRQCRECKQLLDILGIPYIDLQIGEAEAFCAKLNKYGIVNAVLTPDGDSFLFGAHTIFTQYQKTNPIINCCDIKSGKQWNQRTFIALGLLLGSDYCNGVKGIGYKRAYKLLQTAMSEYGIDSYKHSNDALFYILHWCEMSENEIQILFAQNTNRKKHKKIENFIIKIRATYDDCVYLSDIVNAYLDPEFDKNDSDKLVNTEWLKWKCPNLMELCMFAQTYLQSDCTNMVRHTLDIIFDLFLFGFVDRNDLHKFEMSHIIKARVRSKIPMYSVQWQCNDTEINNEIFANQEFEGLKCEGLHFAVSVKELCPKLVQTFEESKPNKKPKKKKKVIKECETVMKPKKKKNYKKKAYYSQRKDWKQPMNTNSNALIYSQNINELNEINELLSSVSLQNSHNNSQKKVQNKNMTNTNQIKRKKKIISKSKRPKRMRKNEEINLCLSDSSLSLFEDSNSDSDSSQNMNVNLRDRIKNKRTEFDDLSEIDQMLSSISLIVTENNSPNIERNENINTLNQIKTNEIDSDSSSNINVSLRDRISNKRKHKNESKQKRKKIKTKEINYNKMDKNGWNCEMCTYYNTQNGLCVMCQTQKVLEQWKCNRCSFSNDNKDKKCKMCRCDRESDVWDLTAYTNANKIENKKQKRASVSPTTHNTSTSTLTWKCGHCKQMIPIHIYACPNCG